MTDLSLPGPSPAEPAPRQPPAPPPIRELLSTELLQGAKEVLIRHGAEVYRLHLTRNGKLILTK